MAWLVLITHQTQPEKEMLRFARTPHIVAREESLESQPNFARPSKSYLAASFSAAIDPAVPSLSASFTLAHSARAMSCLSSAA